MQLQPDVITLKETANTVKKMMADYGAETFVGAFLTVQGTFVLLFSHRLNREFPILVSGNEISPVLSKVYEALSERKL